MAQYVTDSRRLRPASVRFFAQSVGTLALSAVLLACPISTASRPDGEDMASPPTEGVGTSAGEATAPAAAPATTIAPTSNTSPAPAAADPTAAGPVATGLGGANSPNKLIIGVAPAGTATGLLPIVASPNAVAASPNAMAASPNALAASPNTAAPSPNTVVANPNAVATSPNTAAPAPTTTQTSRMWPNIAFNNYSGKLGAKVVALTFDDGPDGTGTGQNNTAGVLDFLKATGIKASFFVCSNVWTDLATDKVAQADLKRIVAEGHDLGSHTFSHPHLDTIAPAAVDQQFAQNLSVVRSVLGSTFAFDKIRAPFGFPFQTNNPNVPTVAPAAAPYGVHIGWGIDTDDWKCAQNNQDSNCIMNNLKAQVAAGGSGPILMHAVYALTVSTLPQIVQYLQQEGYTFVTAEQLVVDKYGQSSASLVAQANAMKLTASQIGAAAVAECKNNKVITVPY